MKPFSSRHWSPSLRGWWLGLCRVLKVDLKRLDRQCQYTRLVLVIQPSVWCASPGPLTTSICRALCRQNSHLQPTGHPGEPQVAHFISFSTVCFSCRAILLARRVFSVAVTAIVCACGCWSTRRTITLQICACCWIVSIFLVLFSFRSDGKSVYSCLP